jgi:xylulokinase
MKGTHKLHYLLGIDLGTSKIKVDLYSIKGVWITGSSIEIKMINSTNNFKEQDPKHWWENLKTILGNISTKNNINLNKIIGVGICGQSHGPTPFNKNKDNIGPCITWMDQRCFEQVKYIEKKIGRKKILDITGFDLDAAYTAAKILWIRQNQPDIYERTEKFLLPKDVLVLKLTGNYSTDITDASVTNLFDLRKKEWSKEIFTKLGFSLEKFPEPNLSTEVVGEITHSIANETGLTKGTPVIAGGADWATGFYGAGGIKPNVGIDMSGTVGTLILTIKDNYIEKSGRSIVPGIKWVLAAQLQTSASVFQWARDEFCLPEQYLADRLDISSFELIDKEIYKIPIGSNGIFVHPHFEGQRNPGNTKLKGVIFGLSLSSSREEILRAILEGIAYEYRKGIEILRESKGIECERIFASGGGSRSDIWNQIKADVINIPFCKSNIQETGTFGAAMLAGVGIGLYSNLSEPIERFLKITKTYNPINNNKKKYDHLYRFYKHFTDNIIEMDLFDGYARLKEI